MAAQVKETVLQICTTPANADLDAAGFAALTYVDICCADELPEFGQDVNALSKHCIDGTEITGVGVSTGKETEFPYTYQETCAGQAFLRNNVESADSYAMRKIYPDATATTTASYIYTRVKILGWGDGGGTTEDFHTHTCSLKLSQAPIFVAPAAI